MSDAPILALARGIGNAPGERLYEDVIRSVEGDPLSCDQFRVVGGFLGGFGLARLANQARKD